MSGPGRHDLGPVRPGGRRHARFGIVVLEILQLEGHRSLDLRHREGSRSFEITPQFHYFVIDKLSVGGAIGYSFTKDPNRNNSTNGDQLFDKSGLFIIRPMVSYYISLGEKFYYVPRFYVGAGFGKNKSEINDTDVTEQNTSMFQVGLNLLNFEFRPSDHIGIMFNAGDLGYRTDITKEGDNKLSNRSFSLGLNLGATIGFNYYF